MSGGAEEYLRFPAVSSDGSHILISTATAGTSTCNNGGELGFGCAPASPPRPSTSTCASMIAVTYEIAEDRSPKNPPPSNTSA